MNLKQIVKVLHNPGIIISRLWVPLSRFIPSSVLFLKVQFWARTGKKLNLYHPKTFCEKMQWLKLHSINPLFTTLVDKYAVRDFVASRIGQDHLIPLLGVYDKFEDIDFHILPEQFVLKTTHDSGGVVICRDRGSFNMAFARKKLNASLRHNYYWEGREYPYRNVPPRIVAEQFMQQDRGGQLLDYKFFTFNGEPKFLYVAVGRYSKEGLSYVYYDMDFTPMPFNNKYHQPSDNVELPSKPDNFDEMKELVKKLCLDVPFVRIDIYSINNKVYFGEYTFFHDGGVVEFVPDEWNQKLGDMIILPTD